MSNSTERLYNQIDMLKKIKFGRKYVDKTPDTNGTFTFIPRDITVRDEEGRFLGTDDITIIHLVGEFDSTGSDVVRYNQPIDIDYVIDRMELVE